MCFPQQRPLSDTASLSVTSAGSDKPCPQMQRHTFQLIDLLSSILLLYTILLGLAKMVHKRIFPNFREFQSFCQTHQVLTERICLQSTVWVEFNSLPSRWTYKSTVRVELLVYCQAGSNGLLSGQNYNILQNCLLMTKLFHEPNIELLIATISA